MAYIVGGSVRDFLLKRPTKDFDIATNALPDELCKLFPEAITVGKQFGVIKIPISGVLYPLEIATFRKDLEYKDSRHPESVVFSDPYDDVIRRDFTVNGLMFDPKISRVLDAVGGLKDLESKTIRAIGNPEERFREDALRLLRAVRFSTQLGFALDSETAAAILARSRLIIKISVERVREELIQILVGPHPAQGVQKLAELGLLHYVLPEIDSLRGAPGAFQAMLKILDKLAQKNENRSMTVAWAALFSTSAKAPGVRADKSLAIEIASSRIAELACLRLKMSREETAAIVALIEDLPQFREVFQMRESTLERFVRQNHFEESLKLERAVAIVSDGNLAAYEYCNRRRQKIKFLGEMSIPKIISGEDLIQLGIQPGPRYSQILRSVEDLVLEKKLLTKDEALEYVLKHFVG